MIRPMPDLEKQLRDVERRYQKAADRAEALRQEREKLARQALAAGWTHARLAEALGKSRGWVSRFR